MVRFPDCTRRPAAAAFAAAPRDEGLNTYSVTIIATAPGFIESQTSWKGPPRLGLDQPLHWSLTLNRPIQAGDLFADPKRAFETITALALADARRDAKAYKETGNAIPSTAEARKAVANLANWTFREEGLEARNRPPVRQGPDRSWRRAG